MTCKLSSTTASEIGDETTPSVIAVVARALKETCRDGGGEVSDEWLARIAAEIFRHNLFYNGRDEWRFETPASAVQYGESLFDFVIQQDEPILRSVATVLRLLRGHFQSAEQQRLLTNAWVRLCGDRQQCRHITRRIAILKKYYL